MAYLMVKGLMVSQPLEDLDSRVKVYPRHGKDWEAYSELRENGNLDDIVEHDWNEGMISDFRLCASDLVI